MVLSTKEPLPPFPPSPPATEPDNTTSSTADNSVVPSAPASHFKLLPGKIRNMIYRYCLVSDRTIVPRIPESEIPSHSLRQPRNGTSGAFFELALGTDKEIFGEVLSLFYGENKFGLSSPYHKCWVNRVGKRSAGCIRAVVIHCEGNANHAKSYLTEMQTALVKRCPNLNSIEHNCDWPIPADFFFTRIMASHMAMTWRRFKDLEMIGLQHYYMPARVQDNSPLWELLAKLCKQSKTRAVAMQRAGIFVTDRAVGEWVENKIEDKIKDKIEDKGKDKGKRKGKRKGKVVRASHLNVDRRD
ncbi:hypothetical protein QC762_405148 [Podospora pseudocomata]|uniref:BTB domain-containing protein n=1 Tax=Podospora pseudocomata TaxID=2093779 RepID=A0ABR0GH10_9PEZI|nr:hypothetical protein QC762_405148 [Podospora pseudocomata]